MKITLEFDTYREMCEYAAFLVGKEPPFDSETLKKAEAAPEKKAEAAPEKKAEAAPEKKAEAAPEKKAEAAPEKKAEAMPNKTDPSELRVFAAEYIRGAKDTADRDTRRHNLKALLDEFQVKNVTMLCDDKPSMVPEFFRRLKEVAAHAE